MPDTRRVLLHKNGPALWPEHKSLAEVIRLQNETPEPLFEATYQANPVPAGGTVFKREWWRYDNRYDPDDTYIKNKVIGRWMSWDTGLKDKETSAFTSCVVGELDPAYRLMVRHVYKERLEFPDLPAVITTYIQKFNRDGKLRGVIIEDKASGISAIQTLSKTLKPNLSRLLVAFEPGGDKVYRAQQAAVHCKNGSVLLPHPTETVSWLIDFEDELFSFPGSAYMDQVDAFSQLILWLENLLSQGYQARNGT